MAGSVNKVILLGHVGKDPEIRNLQSGGKVANLSLATSKRFKDRDGQQQERTEWHRIVVFGPLAEIAEQYVRKGTALYVEGEIQTRKWTDREGVERFTTEISVPQFGGVLQMVGGKRGGGSGDEEQEDRSTGRNQQARREQDRGPPPDPGEDEMAGSSWGNGW